MFSELVDGFPYASLARQGSAAPVNRESTTTSWQHAHDHTRARAAAQAGPGRKVLVIGGDADHNLGDQAILHSLCQALQCAEPGVRITITSSRWGAQRFPGVVRVIPRGAGGFTQALRAARAQDFVVIAGGGLFQDDDSRVKMPYWAARLKLLSLVNPNIRAYAVGAGPLKHAESRWSARAACKVLQQVSVRDAFAQDWLSKCTGQPVAIAPDAAFALEPAPAEVVDSYLESLGIEPGRPIIGVVMRRWYHKLGGFVPHRLRAQAGLDLGDGEAEVARLLDQVALAVKTLARRMNAAVLLLPTYNVGHEADSRYCHHLAAMLPLDTVRVAQLDDPRLYKAVCGRLSLMISARMHPLILAAGMGVPGVGLSYNGKFEGFFDMLGLPRRMLWLDEFRDGAQAERLIALAEDALADPTELRARCEQLRERVLADVAALLDVPAQVAAA